MDQPLWLMPGRDVSLWINTNVANLPLSKYFYFRILKNDSKPIQTITYNKVRYHLGNFFRLHSIEESFGVLVKNADFLASRTEPANLDFKQAP